MVRITGPKGGAAPFEPGKGGQVPAKGLLTRSENVVTFAKEFRPGKFSGVSFDATIGPIEGQNYTTLGQEKIPSFLEV